MLFWIERGAGITILIWCLLMLPLAKIKAPSNSTIFSPHVIYSRVESLERRKSMSRPGCIPSRTWTWSLLLLSGAYWSPLIGLIPSRVKDEICSRSMCVKDGWWQQLIVNWNGCQSILDLVMITHGWLDSRIIRIPSWQPKKLWLLFCLEKISWPSSLLLLLLMPTL